MKAFIGPYPDNGDDPREVSVEIDNYDVWSMDSTLAYIVLPMLKKLKEVKHGGPFVDDDDVPEAIKSTNAAPKVNDWDTDEFWFDRWDYVMDQMIWSFQQIHADNDWEDQFWTEKNPEVDIGDRSVLEWMEGMKYDAEGAAEYQKRITEGFRLFGKYFQALWD